MRLAADEVRHLARLARLGLTEAEVELYAGQLTTVLDAFGRLRSAEVASRRASVEEEGEEAEDVVRPTLPQALFVANAPETLDGFLAVPPVRPTSEEDH